MVICYQRPDFFQAHNKQSLFTNQMTNLGWKFPVPLPGTGYSEQINNTDLLSSLLTRVITLNAASKDPIYLFYSASHCLSANQPAAGAMF